MAQISSGDWQQNPHLTDYRAQLLDKMFVERGRWRATAPTQRLGNTVIMGPGYVWVRFWLLDGEEVIEKYFDNERNVVGFFVPICMPVQRRSAGFVARALILGLWLQSDGRLTVLGESTFDAAAASGELAPVEVEHAEFRIRALTLEINQKRYPPGMVRTFALADEYRG